MAQLNACFSPSNSEAKGNAGASVTAAPGTGNNGIVGSHLPDSVASEFHANSDIGGTAYKLDETGTCRAASARFNEKRMRSGSMNLQSMVSLTCLFELI